MKTKEELNALKEEIETVSKKLADLTEEEPEQVSGGNDTKKQTCPRGFEYVNRCWCGHGPFDLCPIAIRWDGVFYKCPVYSDIFNALPEN